ncbi:MAG: S-methyl-5-thioribose-1-phosphate isomerase [Chloroflexi bacterium]|nr:S-methyl-5-thioribose-1-phosphate isomerase [Chloroflexota bacterium]
MKIIEWQGENIRMLDQTCLPLEEVYLELTDIPALCEAIKALRIRGAPAIGVAAAYGLALGANAINTDSKEEFLSKLDEVSKTLAATRPTAVNLFWALDRMSRVAQAGSTVSEIKAALMNEVKLIEQETDEADRRMGKFGADLIEDGFTILTHCNAGALATAGYGTALGVIKAAHEQGKKIQVFADETRPLLQGAQLTTWEMIQAGIPVTLITDNMAGYFMKAGKIDCVVVGSDRIAANGDVANKIGTYSVSVLAKEHSIPFYVAAPVSTIDYSLKSGDDIPIEERDPIEVTCVRDVRIAPEGVKVASPAFDVTPHQHVSAIITEEGIAHDPYIESLAKMRKGEGS